MNLYLDQNAPVVYFWVDTIAQLCKSMVMVGGNQSNPSCAEKKRSLNPVLEAIAATKICLRCQKSGLLIGTATADNLLT